MNRYITARAKPLQDAADILDPHESHGPTTGLHTAERDAISVTFHDDDWEAYLGDLGIDPTDPLHDRNPDEMTVSELNEFHQWLQAENMWATQESDFDARLAALEKVLPAAIQRCAALKDELALVKEELRKQLEDDQTLSVTLEHLKNLYFEAHNSGYGNGIRNEGQQTHYNWEHSTMRRNIAVLNLPNLLDPEEKK